MLMIRLQRVGRRNDPSYRVVLTDRRRGPQSGAFKEILGSYDPRRETQQINTERIQHWLTCGAQTSGTVYNLLVDYGLIEGKKKNVLPRKEAIQNKEEEKEETPKEEEKEETAHEKEE